MSDQAAIIVKDLHKTFRLPHEQYSGAKQMFVNFFNRKRGYEEQKVLNNISFEIKKGEFFGIVGRNGSGKSTLLKLLAGIYTPDSGSVAINGSLTPFIELGVGFNPELTGRENVYLNGALLGFSRGQMENMYNDIVEFAELEKFMDQKLKNYSSGMQVRLAFSIAIRAKSDILLIDEVLAVGDAAFQQKCFNYFERLKRERRTIILVTHDMGSVERFCTSALLLEDGHIKLIGKPGEVSKQYTLDNLNVAHPPQQEEEVEDVNKSLNPEVGLLEIQLVSEQTLSQSDELKFEITYLLNQPIEVDLGIGILSQSTPILEQNTQALDLDYTVGKKHRILFSYPLAKLNPGTYRLDVAIFEKSQFKLIGFNTDSCSFIIEGKQRGGILADQGEWKVLNG